MSIDLLVARRWGEDGMRLLPGDATWLDFARKIGIESFLCYALIKDLRGSKSCVWIFGKLSRVKTLLAFNRETGVGINLSR